MTEFFERLRDVHLLYWDLSFKYFDPVVLFLAIVGGVGLNGAIAGLDIPGLVKFSLLEVILAVFAGIFCVAWSPFRPQFASVVANLVSLCFALSCLSLIFALVLLLISGIAPVGQVLREFLGRIIQDLRTLPWDSAISAATILYVLSLAVVTLNTLYTVGIKGVRDAILSKEIVPLAVGVILGWLGTLLAVGPIVAAFPE